MTPYYIFNQVLLEQKLRQYLMNYTVFYPCKVNSVERVLKTIESLGGCFEADSIEMVKRLVNKENIQPDRILYNSLIKTDKEVQQAIDLGITRFAVDSMTDVEQIEKKNAEAKYFVRISIKDLLPDIFDNEFVDKWGTTVLNARTIVNYIKTHTKNQILGLSFYFPQEYNNIGRIIRCLEVINDEFSDLDAYSIDVGGGISPEESMQLYSACKSICGNAVKLVIEPGRHLVGDCFDLCCEIIDVRDTGEKKYLFLNVGIYSGFIDVLIKNQRFEMDLCGVSGEAGKRSNYLVCGCTSDISDCFGEYTFTDKEIKKGARLLVKRCGAYCPEMYMRFSGRKVKIKMELSDGREPPSFPNKGNALL